MTGKEAKERLKKQYNYRNAYTKENYDRISVTVPKGTKERIKALGEKPNTIINKLLLDWLNRQEKEPGTATDPHNMN